MEHRRAEHRSEHHEPSELPRRGRPSTAARSRFRTTCRCGSNLKARFRIDGSLAAPASSIDIRDRRRAEHRGVGRGRPRRWPEQTYRREVARALPADARDLLRTRSLGACAATAISRARSICSRAGTIWPAPSRSDVAGVYDYRFPPLYGSLHWTRSCFEVTDAGRSFSGGDARFTFSIEPLGIARTADRAIRRVVSRTSISRSVTDFYELARAALRRTGVAADNLLEWPMRPLPRASRRRRVTVTPRRRRAADDRVARCRTAPRDDEHRRTSGGRSRRCRWRTHLPIAGEVAYRYRPGPRRARTAAGSRPSRRTSRSTGRPRGAASRDSGST